MGCSNCGNGGCGGCSGCGSVDPSQVILNPVPSGVRPCSPLSGTCGNPSPATPAPYYECTPQCQEDHCSNIVHNNYSASVCTTYSFVIPSCEETVNVTFKDVVNLPVGSYLWHDNFGYFRVEAFNSNTGSALLTYRCLDEDKSGLPVPACTCFVVTDPPAEPFIDPLVPYLAEDFTAPANGDCVTISVTSTSGLIVGGEIALASGTYVLDEILSPNTIVICNNGGGVTPGTVVFARNGLGQLQYPILNVQDNACGGTTVTSGSVLVCDGLATRVLTGANVGDVLTLTNTTTGEAEYAPPASLGLDVEADDQTTAPQDIVVPITTTGVTTVLTFVITNTHPTKPMRVQFIGSMRTSLTSPTDMRSFTCGLQHQINGGGYIDLKRVTGVLGNVYVIAMEVVGHTIYTVPAASAITVDLIGFASNLSFAAGDFTAADTTIQGTYLGVAI